MMTEHSTADQAAARFDSLAPYEPLTCLVDMSALRALKMEHLCALRDVFHTLGDIASAFSNTARFGDASDYNDAGKVLNTLTGFLAGYEQAVVNVAVAANPTTRDDAEWRGWTVVGFEADMIDDLADLAVTAANAASDERAAA